MIAGTHIWPRAPISCFRLAAPTQPHQGMYACKAVFCRQPSVKGARAGGAASSVDALREVREAFQAQGKGKTAKTPAVKRQAAGKTW